jgi:hypothetical protein
MKAKITIEQSQVLAMIQKSNPALRNLRVTVQRGYDDRYSSTQDSFVIEADVEVVIPVLDGAE